MKKILVMEDESNIRSFVVINLRRSGYEPIEAATGTEALEKVKANPDICLALLDVMLPEINGFEVLRKIRKDGIHTPVCMLTARGELSDRVHGLESGADYYLPKPFQSQELIACLRAITRRKEDAPVMELSFGDISLIQQEAKLVNKASGQSVKLGAKEYQLMELFVLHPGFVFSTEHLMDKIWGLDSESDIDVVWTHIGFVRKKLRGLDANVEIKTIRGAGYSLEVNA